MTGRDRRRSVAVVAVVVGLGLALAPAAFGMFTRAPGGGQMLDGFRPFMNGETVDRFQGHMATIGAAVEEAPDDSSLPAVAALKERWPTIDDDMGSMLVTMSENLDNFAAVDALPPFALFPFFFVLPGLFLAAGAVWYLRSGRAAALRVVAAVAVGLIAAPFIFQMFDRAPKGGAMIDDFRPLMSESKVQAIQGYFLVLGAGEGELRTKVLPAADGSELPAVRSLASSWPGISNEMAPMIGAMSDNVANYQGVDAMPPFPLFPWFFVAPGVLVLVLLAVSRPRRLDGVAVPSTALVVVALLLLGGCGSGDGDAAGSGEPDGALVGLFGLEAGSCSTGGVEKGSWFRMVQSGGSVEAGPFVPNGDSSCGDKSWTPLSPGSDGGLLTGAFQPQPDPAFDPQGNATSAAIIEPVKWFAVSFGLASNETDPQTGKPTATPTVADDGGALSGNLSAVAASWNGQHFNQGTPKPGAAADSSTLTGTYDPTGRYTMEWTSRIEGGPFNGFTGVWHLEGVFTRR